MHIMDKEIMGITCNSKKVKKGFVFVAIKGRKLDGNNYINEAIKNGAIIIYTEDNIKNKNIPIIKVENSRIKLAELLNEFYDYPTKELFIIGVTGTNGKTTTTHLIESIFKKSHIKTSLIGSLGIKTQAEYKHISMTTPDSEDLYKIFFELNKIGTQVVVMEVSSHALKLYRTYGIEFNIAIHTNIDIDHLDFHKTFEDYLNSKKMLFDSLGENKLAIINTDDENAVKILEGNNKVLTISYGLNSKSTITASSININENLNFSVCIQRTINSINGKSYEPQEFNISMNISGLYNVYNSLAAISCALYYGLDINAIKEGLKEIKSISRRFEKIYDGDYIVIDDFCHNPSSYQSNFDRIKSLNYNKIIIVNSIRGNRGSDINKENAVVLASWYELLNKPKIIISLSEDVVDEDNKVKNEEIKQFENILKEYKVPYEIHKDLYHSIQKSISYVEKGDIILLLGSQGMDKGNIIFKKIAEI